MSKEGDGGGGVGQRQEVVLGGEGREGEDALTSSVGDAPTGQGEDEEDVRAQRARSQTFGGGSA